MSEKETKKKSTKKSSKSSTKKAEAKPPPAIAPPPEEFEKKARKTRKEKPDKDDKHEPKTNSSTLPRTGKDAPLPVSIHGKECDTCHIKIDLSLIQNHLYAGALTYEEKEYYAILHATHLGLFASKEKIQTPKTLIHLDQEAVAAKGKKSNQWKLTTGGEDYSFTTDKVSAEVLSYPLKAAVKEWLAAIPLGAKMHPGVTCFACGKTFDFAGFDEEVITRKAVLSYKEKPDQDESDAFCILAAGHLGVYESEEAMKNGEFMKRLIHTPKNHLEKIETAFKFKVHFCSSDTKETGEFFKAGDNQGCLDWLGAIHLQNV